jgi:hypothetical protein
MQSMCKAKRDKHTHAINAQCQPAIRQLLCMYMQRVAAVAATTKNGLADKHTPLRTPSYTTTRTHGTHALHAFKQPRGPTSSCVQQCTHPHTPTPSPHAHP